MLKNNYFHLLRLKHISKKSCKLDYSLNKRFYTFDIPRRELHLIETIVRINGYSGINVSEFLKLNKVAVAKTKYFIKKYINKKPRKRKGL